jgi:hypothetical protein
MEVIVTRVLLYYTSYVPQMSQKLYVRCISLTVARTLYVTRCEVLIYKLHIRHEVVMNLNVSYIS